VNDFGDFLGTEPAWQRCQLCNVETMRPKCFACERRLDQAKERLEQERICGIPARFDWAQLEAQELADRVKSEMGIATLAKRILEAPNVAVGGGTGVGKTSLAVACLRRVAPHCLFVRAERLARAPIEHSSGSGEAPIVARAKNVRVLLIDDLGTDEQTKVSAVRDVVFWRHDAGLSTWITTGISSSEIENLYGSGFKRRAISEAVTIRLGTKQ